VDHGDQRLRDADRRPLSHRAAQGTGRGRRARAAAADAVERRPHHRRGVGRAPDPHHRVGAGGRCGRRAGARPGEAPAEDHHLRHGRHHREGGETPTVTDANLLLGYLNPAHLVGGALKLNAAKAREVFTRKIAEPLRMPLERAAHGAHLIAASNMIRAIRAVSSERGRDPREFALFAFGGNGPVFACGMAQALGMKRIVVPPSAGLFSSFGLLYADVEHHYARTFRRLLRKADSHELERAWDELSQKALEQLASEGFAEKKARVRRSATLHYQGQTYELSVPLPDGPIDLAYLEEAFGREHEKTYG